MRRRHYRTLTRLLALACLLWLARPLLSAPVGNVPDPVKARTSVLSGAVVLEATMQDSLIDDAQDGEVNQGDRLRYTIVIRNTGDVVAQGIQYSDALSAFTALVPGTVATTPIARDDRYVAAPETQSSFGAPGVLANDSDSDNVGPALVVESFDATSAASATPNVNVAADGAFHYQAPPGFRGTDTFRYQMGDGEGNSASAQVSITVALGPSIVYLDIPIDSNDPGVFPCVATEPCTIPTFTDFSVRFSATTPSGTINGYTWQIPPSLWQPFGTVADTHFVNLETIDGDTLAFDPQGRPAWEISASQESVTVHLYSNRTEAIVPGGRYSGDVLMRARARNDAGAASSIAARSITVNYDPDTRLFSVPECDCPNATPGCNSLELVPAGWVTGIGKVDALGTIDDWRLFCQGDTIPNASRVSFYARGWDDARDRPIDPMSPLPETSISFRFEYSGADFSNASMRFSLPRSAIDLPLPMAVGGGVFRGASAGWQACPYDYRFEAAAVDEHLRFDGTSAEIEFFVGGSPSIDSLHVPRVLVFVPTCTTQRSTFCQDQNIPEHWLEGSRDTLAVFGTPEEDAFNPAEWQTAWGLGWNTFVIPFRAFGHDHPRDQNPPGGPQYYGTDDEGHIRSWKFSFDCVAPACEDQQLRGEDVWEPNVVPVGQGPVDVFDDLLVVQRIPLDTLCVADEGAGCSFDNSRAALLFTKFGDYLFEIQGRDTEFIGQTCLLPLSLDEGAELRPTPLSSSGRTTQLVHQAVSWIQLRDARPRAGKTKSAVGMGNRPPERDRLQH